MALANPRKITVNGTEYHWKVSTRRELHLAVIEPGTARKLVVFFAEKRAVPPAVVRAFIEEVEALGWTGPVRWNR